MTSTKESNYNIDILCEYDVESYTALELSKYIEETTILTLSSCFNKLESELEICIAIVDDKKITELNKEFRNKDYPTNVLSFPESNLKWYQIYSDSSSSSMREAQNYLMLGDVIISYQTILKEASQQGKNLIDHLRHMVIHGILHLIGFDHENDEDAAIMESKEEQLLACFNIPSPYKI